MCFFLMSLPTKADPREFADRKMVSLRAQSDIVNCTLDAVPVIPDAGVH